MSKFFRSRHSPKPTLDQSAYSSLLDPGVSVTQQPSQQHRDRASPLDYHSRSWLAVVENRASWTGERPPTRKLVKDMNGSRPSSSLELSDTDAEKEKGIVRRQLARLKELYRRDK
jgi:hypothetical protein